MNKHKVRPERYYINSESEDKKLGQVWINKANKWNCSEAERIAFLNTLVEVKNE